MRVILASASPRRRELFGKLFADFEVIPALGEEVCTQQLPKEAVQQLSAQKAIEIEQRLYKDEHEDMQEYLIVGSDTVVAWEGTILGKPKDAEDAKKTLGMLSGNVHQVYTGVTLICQKSGKRVCRTFAECTDVKFYPMSPDEIAVYVQTKEPMDKAGSYGIQGIGGRFVESITGSYDNVVGLPVSKLYHQLKEMSCCW